MKNPHFVNFPMDRPFADSDSGELLMSKVGRNTGNLLFVTAIHKVVKHASFSPRMGFWPKYIKNRGHDGLIVPAANWLSASSDLGKLAERIEMSGLPCVIVGLGAQSSEQGRIPVLSKGTQRLVHVISERCHSISVRGEFSAEVLDSYGIQNVRVTGCPSLLWHVDRPAKVERSPERLKKISTLATRENSRESLDDPGVRNRASMLITRMAFEHKFDFVAQTEVPDINGLRGTYESDSDKSETMEYLRNAYGTDDDNDVLEYLHGHLRVFTNVVAWLDYLTTQDFVFGTRLHGVIASLLAGTPAVLVTHDTRTAEMAEYLSIPSVDAEELLNRRPGPTEMYESADYDAFNDRMPAYFENFRAFFAENDVEVNI